MESYLKYLLMTIIYILLLSVLLLKPFHFHIPIPQKNYVEWIPETNAVAYSSVGLIRSPGPTSRLYDDLVSGMGLTLEVWVATKTMAQQGPARIVSYSLDKLMRNFTLGQDQKALIMRLRTTNTDLNGRNPDIRVENVFSSLKPMHIVATYDYSTEIVYVNGNRKLTFSGPGGNFSNWNSSYSLVMGNELTNNRPWRGTLFLVAIYNRALSKEEIWKNFMAGRGSDDTILAPNGRVEDGLVALYLFNEREGHWIFDRSGKFPPLDLKIPTNFQIHEEQKLFLSPYKDFDLRSLTFKQAIGMIGNIIIFIPVGFLLHTTMRRKYQSPLGIIAFVFILGTLFTLIFESLQYFLMSRISSMTDVVNNILGTAVGVIIDKSWYERTV